MCDFLVTAQDTAEPKRFPEGVLIEILGKCVRDYLRLDEVKLTSNFPPNCVCFETRVY